MLKLGSSSLLVERKGIVPTLRELKLIAGGAKLELQTQGDKLMGWLSHPRYSGKDIRTQEPLADYLRRSDVAVTMVPRPHVPGHQNVAVAPTPELYTLLVKAFENLTGAPPTAMMTLLTDKGRAVYVQSNPAGWGLTFHTPLQALWVPRICTGPRGLSETFSEYLVSSEPLRRNGLFGLEFQLKDTDPANTYELLAQMCAHIDRYKLDE